MPFRVFISHAHEDKALVDALKSLIANVFRSISADAVQVDYSSDDAPGQGPGSGAEWLMWILDTVREADCCIVLLTEDSISAPWLTWEAGAVTGAALSAASISRESALKRIVPLLIGPTPERIPPPLRYRTAVNGERATEIVRLLFDLHRASQSADAFPQAVANEQAGVFVGRVRKLLNTRLRERPARVQLAERAPLYFVNNRSAQRSRAARAVLEPWRGEIANGIRLYCGNFTGDAHQQWILRPVSKGIYSITTWDQSKCLSIRGDSLRDGAAMVLWDYERHDTQHWEFVCDPGPANGLGTVRVINRASRMCLMPRPDDAQLVQTPYTSLQDQDWWILSAPVLQMD